MPSEESGKNFKEWFIPGKLIGILNYFKPGTIYKLEKTNFYQRIKNIGGG
jgi:hypothetical protein